MGKFWGAVFFLVPVLGAATFIAAPYFDTWLPEDVSRDGAAIDHLFYFILALTGVVFLVTEFVLFYFIAKYSRKPGEKRAVVFTHGSHTLEVVWTIIPTAVLLFIALYQMNVWADAKVRTPPEKPLVEVTARQFEWRLRYPGPDGELGTSDDLFTVNDLHVPVDEEILVHLKSMDVLHSFFLPNLRVKQDAVPGMQQNVWFRATQTGQFDLVCAELCGWGHYKMKGRLTVESRAQFDAWQEDLRLEQERIQESAQAASD